MQTATSAHIYKDELESQRLITRFLTMEDIHAWSKFFDDEEAVELFPTYGLTTSEGRATHWIQKQLTRYKENTFGLQVLIDRKTNDFIGQSGIAKQLIDGKTEVEVGYHVFKKYWGQGYAPEAAKLFINYAFQNDLTDSVISIIDIRNLKSQIVAQKNGLEKEKQTRWSDLDVFIFRIKKKIGNRNSLSHVDPILESLGQISTFALNHVKFT